MRRSGALTILTPRPAAAASALCLVLAIASAARAQSAPDAAPPRISERAQREADGPMRWIKLHSETVRRSDARKAAAAPVPASQPTLVAKAPVGPSRASATTIAAAALAARADIDAAADERLDTSSLVSIDHVDPEWDEDVLRKLRKGHVVVRFQVAVDGYLSRIQIVESTNSRLTGPAMAAVMQWRFAPIAEPRIATAEFGFDIDAATSTR